MKHCRLLIIIAALMLLSTAVGAANGSIFNFPNVNPVGFSQFTDFQMMQGWANGKLVWFIATDSSDQQIACDTTPKGEFADGLNYAPSLVDVAGELEAAIVYVITNVSQGPVFTAVPGDDTYSGVCRLVFVTYNPGALKHVVKNDDPYNAVTNPTGLPSGSDATYRFEGKAGLPIVVKYPIMAVGPLGGPWSPAIPGSYRIAQGKVDPDYAYTKIIWLPFWQEYCRDPITKRISVRRFIVPDVFDPPGLPLADQLAPKLRANVAPALGLIDDGDAQPFFLQLGPQPASQFPIVMACPSLKEYPCENSNYDYTPVQQVIVLQRNYPLLPASTVINNEPTLFDLFIFGRLSIVRDTQIIDAPILPESPG